jgi:hypothetical protein
MLCRMPRPSAWMINHFRAQAVSAWKCARFPPSARAGRAPEATLSRTTTWRTPQAASGSAVLCKADMTRRADRQVLREFMSRLGSSSRETRYSWLAPLTPNCPQARWDFHCNLRPGPGPVLADVSFIHPLAASYIRSAAGTPGYARALRDADKRRDYFADHNCPRYAYRAISFETLGQFSPGAMQFLCKATHAAFPQPGHQRAVCFANVYRQLSMVQCHYLSRMLTAAAGLHKAHRGSGWIRGARLPLPEVPH